MNFKKRVNGSWTDISHYIHNTSTDTITTLPAVLYPNGTTATVGLKGQTLQSSVPSPTSPVMPEGTGERTGNLLNYTTVESSTYATATQISGGISVSGRYYVRFRTVEFTVGSTYTMSWKANTTSGTSAPSWRFHYSDNTYSTMLSSGGALIAEKEVSELLLYVSTSNSCIVEFTEIMLNLGSTPLPYEPWGIKIPISSANTTTPVYLGEVQSTRQIKKLVLTGTENWSISGAWKKTNTSVFYFPVSDIGGASDYERYILSTHFASKSRTELYRDDIEGISKTGSNAVTVRVDDTIATTVNDFKAWLRDNNVTIWYVLKSETTGIVNEPLMKIGDYADTVSNVSIPVTAGGDTLSVGTTVQPSEVTVNYKGWHPVADVHERDNGAWT